MAKNFGSSAVSKRFGEVAKSTMANTDFAAVKLIENADISDYPENGEDILYTADLENSIGELGFTDPIEVTGYKMPEGKYMIVSGHRRRAAGVKCGMDLFPCIIKQFENENDVKNYVLLANSQRDSAKDPLLYCKRYKLHEQHLKAINFKGSAREEIAKRLGISVQQADRYNQMNKIIEPVWELVREEIVGMSGVLPMAVLTRDEQQDVFNLLKRHIDGGTELTRDKIKEIIEGYKNKSPHRADFQKQKTGAQVIKAVKALARDIQEINVFKDSEEAEEFLGETEKLIKILNDKSYFAGRKYGIEKQK